MAKPSILDWRTWTRARRVAQAVTRLTRLGGVSSDLERPKGRVKDS